MLRSPKSYRSWEDHALFQRFLFLFQKKLLGALMQRGFRLKAAARLQRCFLLLKHRLAVSPLLLLLVAFLRLAPEVHLKGSTQHPTVAPVGEGQKITLAVRWLLQSQGRSFSPQRLADALQEASENRGPAVEFKLKIYGQAALHKQKALTYKYL